MRETEETTDVFHSLTKLQCHAVLSFWLPVTACHLLPRNTPVHPMVILLNWFRFYWCWQFVMGFGPINPAQKLKKVIIYSPSCHFEHVWLSVSWSTRRDVQKFTLLNSEKGPKKHLEDSQSGSCAICRYPSAYSNMALDTLHFR